jgi:phenylalanine-4-hydroxylase
VRVEGHLISITKQEHKILLMSFSDCTVTGPAGEILFEPGWGQYDMAVGEHITSVYPGSADRGRYDVYPAASREATRRPQWTDQDQVEFALYARVRELRDAGSPAEEALSELFTAAREQAPQAWLLFLELLELAPADGALVPPLREHLKNLGKSDAEWRVLIERGLKLLDNAPLAA